MSSWSEEKYRRRQRRMFSRLLLPKICSRRLRISQNVTLCDHLFPQEETPQGFFEDAGLGWWWHSILSSADWYQPLHPNPIYVQIHSSSLPWLHSFLIVNQFQAVTNCACVSNKLGRFYRLCIFGIICHSLKTQQKASEDVAARHLQKSQKKFTVVLIFLCLAVHLECHADSNLFLAVFSLSTSSLIAPQLLHQPLL